MDNKPIKRNKNIQRLSKEHHFSLLFCWKIRQGLKYQIAAERMIKYVEYFSAHFLLPHFREEEDFLFSLLNDRRISKAIEEHKEIKNCLDELENDSIGDKKDKLIQLADIVDNHIRYEERELFPFIEKHLSNEQLDAVNKKLMELPFPLSDDYADSFWMK